MVYFITIFNALIEKTHTNLKQVRTEFFDPFFNNMKKKISNIRRYAKLQFLQGVVDLVMVEEVCVQEEVWNVDQSQKEAKTINKVIEQVTSNSTTFRQFFRLFPNGGTDSHLSAVQVLVQSLAI